MERTTEPFARVIYEVQAFRQGRWTVVMTSSDKDEAVAEAIRLSHQGRAAGVRVEAERFDPETGTFRSHVVFQRLPDQTPSGEPARPPLSGEPPTTDVPPPSRAPPRPSREWAMALRALLAIGVVLIGFGLIFFLHALAAR